MNTRSIAHEHLAHPRSLTAFRSMKLLAGGYLAISVLALMAIVVLRGDHAAVNAAVWTRGTIVAASALLTYALTARAARGSRRAYLRLRIITAVMVAAIAVIIALPRHLPAMDEDGAGYLRAPLDRRRRNRQRQASAIAVRHQVDQAYPRSR